MKPGTSVIFLPCSDIAKTVSFYHDLLGLPVDQKQGDSLYIFDTGYGYWGFCQYGDARKLLSGPQGVCLSMNLENDEAVRNRYAELKDRCDIYRGPQKHPQFPVYSFFLQDPDGYLVEFQNVYQQ